MFVAWQFESRLILVVLMTALILRTWHALTHDFEGVLCSPLFSQVYFRVCCGPRSFMCGFVHGLYGYYQLVLGAAKSRCQKSSLCCSRCVRRCAVQLLGSPSVVWLIWCTVFFSICTWDDSISCGCGELVAFCSSISAAGGMFCCFVCWRFARRAVVGGASPSGFATGG